MIDHLEVAPGPGTVIRYGAIVAWAGPSASPALISFLTQSARNLGPSARGGVHMVDHISGVLAMRDPEPEVPFAVIGPGDDGWAALLHGPVQAWDGADWLVPDAHPGWVKARVRPGPSVSVNAAGARVPTLSPDSIWDLESGVVPGSGFVLVPLGGPVPQPSAHAERAPVVAAPAAEPPSFNPEPTSTLDIPSPTTVLPIVDEPQAGAPELADLAVPASAPSPSPPAAEPSPSPSAAEPFEAGPLEAEPFEAEPLEAEPLEAEPAVPGPQGSINLRTAARSSLAGIPLPPLPIGAGPDRSTPGAPVVAGVLCPRGHINRPGIPVCIRCSTSIPRETAFSVSGARPALGCLIIDDGSVYRLDRGYLVGSRPDRDPTVRGRLALPLCLRGEDVSATHAEIRLQDWDVVLIDRASASGTFVFEPGGTQWSRLTPYEQNVLPPGCHIAFGQRIATFVTPWIIREDAAGQETSDSNFGQ